MLQSGNSGLNIDSELAVSLYTMSISLSINSSLSNGNEAASLWVATHTEEAVMLLFIVLFLFIFCFLVAGVFSDSDAHTTSCCHSLF